MVVAALIVMKYNTYHNKYDLCLTIIENSPNICQELFPILHNKTSHKDTTVYIINSLREQRCEFKDATTPLF